MTGKVHAYNRRLKAEHGTAQGRAAAAMRTNVGTWEGEAPNGQMTGKVHAYNRRLKAEHGTAQGRAAAAMRTNVGTWEGEAPIGQMTEKVHAYNRRLKAEHGTAQGRAAGCDANPPSTCARQQRVGGRVASPLPAPSR